MRWCDGESEGWVWRGSAWVRVGIWRGCTVGFWVRWGFGEVDLGDECGGRVLKVATEKGQMEKNNLIFLI